ncbi:hypothetical protein [Hyphomicrobium sp.]|uniref:hypothetical protein n=1 Tax=Hyphomicrobium sp. TaxID=82 RepID=UPI001D7B4261|nr:hypothetical protein [Hyphomicrobium sp.]MBY0559902.1 hypothetical protein [Hyphomicrobium sp.]
MSKAAVKEREAEDAPPKPEPVTAVLCSSCGADISKRDCKCKGDGKLLSGWKTQ